MTGWRLGWLICPAAFAGYAAGLQEPVTSCASTVAQKAAEAALTGSRACVAEFCDRFRRRRDIVVEILGQSGQLPTVPRGAFYAWLDIRNTGLDSLTFCKDLLRSKAVAMAPGSTFGAASDGFARIAFTTDDDSLRTGLDRVRTFMAERSAVVT